MKIKIMVPKIIDIKTLRIEIPIYYKDEDIPYDFPLRKDDVWAADIDIDSGVIKNWPAGESRSMYVKVCDGGTYELLDDKGVSVAKLENEYVPHGLIPGDYGDYVDFSIAEDGRITNWDNMPCLVRFFEGEVKITEQEN